MKLGATVQTQFKKKLLGILANLHIPVSKLSGTNNLYKIKLRQVGYRLVYEVNDQVITVTVIAVVKQEGSLSDRFKTLPKNQLDQASDEIKRYQIISTINIRIHKIKKYLTA